MTAPIKVTKDMAQWLKLLRIAALTLSLCGAVICGIVNTPMSLPYILLTLLLWSEKSRSRLGYLGVLSTAFGLYGIPEAFDRTFIHRSTLDGLPQLMLAELALLSPILAGRIWRRIREQRKGLSST